MAKTETVEDAPADARYPGYGPQVNAVLDVARAARHLESITGTPAANVIQHLERAAQGRWWSLIDIILDLEEAQEMADEDRERDAEVLDRERSR
jgi:hypothetical protein